VVSPLGVRLQDPIRGPREYLNRQPATWTRYVRGIARGCGAAIKVGQRALEFACY